MQTTNEKKYLDGNDSCLFEDTNTYPQVNKKKEDNYETDEKIFDENYYNSKSVKVKRVVLKLR